MAEATARQSVRPLWVGIALLVVGLLVAAVLVVLQYRDDGVTATVDENGLHLQIGRIRIDAPPGVAPAGTTVTARLVAPPPGNPLLPAVGTGVDVVLEGNRQPAQPVTITLPAADGYTVGSVDEITGPEDIAPVALSRPGPAAPLRSEPAVYDAATDTVTITTDHLTTWWQALLDIGDIAAEISRRAFGGETARPGCHAQPAVDATGRELLLTPTERPSVWSCVRGDGDEAVVELTNTTPGPWVVRAPGAVLEPQAELSLADAFLIAAGPYIAGDPVLPVHGAAAYRFPLDTLPGQIELSTNAGIYLLSIFATMAGVVGEVLDLPILKVVGKVDAALVCLGGVLRTAGTAPPTDTFTDLVECVDLVIREVPKALAEQLGKAVVVLVAAAPLISSGVAGALGRLLGPQQILIERGPEVTAPGSAPAVRPVGAGASPIVFVVDTSDSMGETDGSGAVKLESAREALIQRINSDLTATSATGLWTYPGGGSCSPGAFQREVRVGPTSELGAQLRRLTAAGNTPTAAALTAVRDALAADGYRAATLVLVSDGESNCGEPPCDVARAIVDSGFDLRVHAVGFDISPAGQSELGCIASATGGRYLDSPDGEQLAELLQGVSRPQLDLQVAVPETTPAGIPVDVTARLRVAGGAPADDVRLDVEARGGDGTVLPVLGPVVRLGNLAPGTEREQTWSFTVPTAADVDTLRIVASARSATARPVVVERALTVRGELTAADVGPVLRPVADGAGQLVIMGDSWSSGEGAGGYEGTTDTVTDRCHRSPRTYGAEIFSGDRYILACSGATTEHFFGSQRTGDPGAETSVRPQIDQLRDVAGETAAVALTIGGNDIGFRDVIVECLMLSGAYSCDPLNPHRAERIALLEQTALAQIYEDVHGVVNAPDAVDARDGLVAPVIVLPYATPVNRLGTGCGAISATEADRLRDLTDALNAAIERAVRTARERGADVHFASDVQDAFLPDHTLCAPDSHLVEIPPGLLDRAVVDRITLTRSEDPTEQEIAHPTAAGYAAITAALVRWSQRPLPPAPAPGAAQDVETWHDDGEPLRVAAGTTVDVGAGRTVALAGGGFAPGASVRLEVRSVPRVVGAAPAGANGRVEVQGQVPGDLAPGAHELVLVGSDLAGRPHEVAATLDVRAPVPWWALGGLPVLAVVALAGAGRVLLGPGPDRTRRRKDTS